MLHSLVHPLIWFDLYIRIWILFRRSVFIIECSRSFYVLFTWCNVCTSISCSRVFIVFSMAQSRRLFNYFRPFLITISTIPIVKSVYGEHGIQNHSPRVVGADETTELCRPPRKMFVVTILTIVRSIYCYPSEDICMLGACIVLTVHEHWWPQ